MSKPCVTISFNVIDFNREGYNHFSNLNRQFALRNLLSNEPYSAEIVIMFLISIDIFKGFLSATEAY